VSLFSPLNSQYRKSSNGDRLCVNQRAYGGSGSREGCARTSGGTFSWIAPQSSFVFAFSASEAVVAVAEAAQSSSSPPSSHLTRSTPASHCELSEEGDGESLPADSESGGEDDTEPVLCTMSPQPTRVANASGTGDGVRACTVVSECECAW